MSSQTAKLPHPIDDVFWRETEDGLVLIDPRGGEVKALNKTGGFIWQALAAAEDDLDSLAAKVAAHFEVEREQARQDILVFIETLQARRLVKAA